MKRVGEIVYAIVTDHPTYPRIVYADSSMPPAYYEKSIAESTCKLWNGDEPREWPFRVIETTVVDRESTGQLSLLSGH